MSYLSDAIRRILTGERRELSPMDWLVAAHADRLASTTPITQEDAELLIREHGAVHADDVAKLVTQGWRDAQLASERLRGVHGRWWQMQANFRLNGRSETDAAAMADYMAAPFTPQHNQPKSPQIKPCHTCQYYSRNGYLACAVHPTGRPGDTCPDWEGEAPPDPGRIEADCAAMWDATCEITTHWEEGELVRTTREYRTLIDGRTGEERRYVILESVERGCGGHPSW